MLACDLTVCSLDLQLKSKAVKAKSEIVKCFMIGIIRSNKSSFSSMKKT